MLTNKDLSNIKSLQLPDASEMHFGIVVAEWNSEITHALYNDAQKTLVKCGCKEENIILINVPGSFELTNGAQFLIEHNKLDAVICLGCIIQGETRHFEFICQAVAQGLTNLSLRYSKPVIFGVLTTDNMKQAKDRSEGKHSKGVEAAITAIKMAGLKNQNNNSKSIGF